MSITIHAKENQAIGHFNNGEILENKPIGFPQDGGRQLPYSNLFYWAHAHSTIGSTIGLHPHRGFEIVSYVLKGGIKHYDTKTDVWKELSQGDFQVIQSGNGVSHSEELLPNSAIFQIWFDPNLSKSLYQNASYKDYNSSEFPTKSTDSMQIKTIAGGISPVKLDTEDIEIEELKLSSDTSLDLDKATTYSIYVLEGESLLNSQKAIQDDFVILENEAKLNIQTITETKLFIISSPKTPSYKTYINS